MPPTNSYKTVEYHNHCHNSHNYYTDKSYVVEPVQPNSTQPNPWMDPTHVHTYTNTSNNFGTRSKHHTFYSNRQSNTDIFRPIACRHAVERSVTIRTFKSHKYVCITTYQPDTESNPNPKTNHSPINKPNIQLNKCSHMSYVSRWIHTRHVVAPLHRLYQLML